MFKAFLKILGILYNPEKDFLQTPFTNTEPVKPAPLEPGISYVKGKAYKFKKEDRALVWELIGSRPALELGQSEIEALIANGLKPDKAGVILSLWKEGRTAKEAALALEGRAGYGLRTLEKYYSFFNALSSPIEIKGHSAN